MNDGTLTGKVKFFKSDKGYGFITASNGSGDIFFHKSKVKKGITLKQDDNVEFEVEQTDKGINAIDVRKV